MGFLASSWSHDRFAELLGGARLMPIPQAFGPLPPYIMITGHMFAVV